MRSIVIMAGGMSRRMGRDKVFLDIGGKSFIEHICRNALTVFDEVYISADTKERAQAIHELPVITKNVPYHNMITDLYLRCGPIGGICSVFEKTALRKFSVIPADVPLADMQVLGFFFDICNEKPVIYVRDNKDVEPLIGAYDSSCIETFKENIRTGKNKILKSLEDCGYMAMTESDIKNKAGHLRNVDFDRHFANINSPEEYEKMLLFMQKRYYNDSVVS